MGLSFLPFFQEDSWIPNEAVFHFFIGTPKSDLKRDLGVDLNFSVPQKKFRIQFIQPKKKVEIDGGFFNQEPDHHIMPVRRTSLELTEKHQYVSVGNLMLTLHYCVVAIPFVSLGNTRSQWVLHPG